MPLSIKMVGVITLEKFNHLLNIAEILKGQKLATAALKEVYLMTAEVEQLSFLDLIEKMLVFNYHKIDFRNFNPQKYNDFTIQLYWYFNEYLRFDFSQICQLLQKDHSQLISLLREDMARLVNH